MIFNGVMTADARNLCGPSFLYILTR